MGWLREAADVLAAGILPALGQLLVVGLVVVLAYVPGRWWRDRLLGGFQDPAASPGQGRLETAVVGATLGLIFFATAGFALGLAGVLGPWSFLAVVAASQALGTTALGGAGWRDVWSWARLGAGPRGPVGSGRGASTGAARAFAAVGLLASGLGLVILALLSAYPAMRFDETAYHLPFTRGFVESGGLPVLPDLVYSVFPQMGEMLWVPTWSFLAGPGAHALVLVHALLAAGAVYAWGADLAGRRSGVFAAALWLGSPGVVLYGTVGYVDVVVGHFVAVAGLAVHRALDRVPESGVRSGRWRWRLLWVAGVAAGAAAATKYHGLLFIALLAAVLVGSVVLGRPSATERRGLGRGLLAYLVLAGAVAAPWYAHIHHATGNPLHPFVWQADGRVSSDPGPLLGAGGGDSSGGAWARWVGIVVRDWDDVPRHFLEQTVTGARSHGPPFLDAWFLLLLPLAVLPRLRPPGSGWPLAVVGAFLAAWFFSARDPRYLLHAAVLLCPVAGAVAARFVAAVAEHGGSSLRAALASRGVTLALALALLAPGALYAAFHLARLGPVPVAPAAVDLYLSNRLPGYAAQRWLEAEAGSAPVYAVGGTRLAAFAAGRWIAPTSGVLPSAGEGELAVELRRQGADYLLWIPGGTVDASRADLEATARRLAGEPGLILLRRVGGAEVYRLDVAAPDGADPPTPVSTPAPAPDR